MAVSLMILDSGLFCILISAVFAVLETTLLILPPTIQFIRKPWMPAILFLVCFSIYSFLPFHL